MDQDDVIEQTLFIATDVHVYRIPPRPAAGGYKSGEWRVGDEIFLGRLRLLAIGDEAEIRLEDVNTGELFALVPIRQGERHIVVESATDSSRNFVIRVENPETKAHAFLGMGFETRNVAFDFNAALEDNERRLTRKSVGPSAMSPEIAALHKPVSNLQLKEGETIKVNIKNKVVAPKKSSPNQKLQMQKLSPPPGQDQTGSWATFD